MTLYNVWMDIKEHGIETAFLVYAILKMIDIAPIKINPWTSLVNGMRAFFMGDLPAKIERVEENQAEISQKFEATQNIMKSRFEAIDEQMKNNFSEIREDISFSEAMSSRYRLIRTADELTNGLEPSKDHLEILLQDDLQIYQGYCDAHPEFINHKGRRSVQMLLIYEEALIRKEAEENYGKRVKKNEN